MAIFGLGSSKKKKPAAKKPAKAKKGGKAAARGGEAKAVLAKMKAKKDAGDCAFC